MSTVSETGSAEDRGGTLPAEASAQRSRRLYLPTIVIAGLAAWLSWRGWNALEQFGPARSITAGRLQLAGPVVIGFVAVVFTTGQLWPAERRPMLARGHLLDLGYLLFYAVLVVPLIVLIGSGSAGLLARLEPWLVLPRVPAVPGWCFIVLAVLGIDAVDWLAHLGNHRPVPVEQVGPRPRLARTILVQLAEPFTSIRTESR